MKEKILFAILFMWIVSCTNPDHYKTGLQLFENGLYEDAIVEFNKVHSSSRAYPDAQQYIEGCNTMLR